MKSRGGTTHAGRFSLLFVALTAIVTSHTPVVASASSLERTPDPRYRSVPSPAACAMAQRVNNQSEILECLRGVGPSPYSPGLAESHALEGPPTPAHSGPASVADCGLPGIDDRCEKWAAVYDDAELYGDIYPIDDVSASDTFRRMAVSPIGDRVFSLSVSIDQKPLRPPIGRWAIVTTNAETGDQLWVAHRPWPAETLVDIAASPDGSRVYVTGFQTVGQRDGDWYPLLNTNVVTIAYDAAIGKKLWERTFRATPLGHRSGDEYDLHSVDAGLGVVTSPTGDRLYVTGITEATQGFYDVLVLAYDAATGVSEWSSVYDTSTTDYPHARDEAIAYLAEVSPDGKRLYLAGYSCKSESSQDPCDYLAVAYQAHDSQSPSGDGRRLWVQRLGAGPRSDAPTSLDVAPDGSRLYLTGFRGGSDASPGYVTAAYEAVTGERIWVSGYADGTVRWPSLAASPRGDKVFVTGGPRTVAYDAAVGEQVWEVVSNDGQLASVAVSPDGNRVYASGSRLISGAAERLPVSLAYDAATGQQAWVAIYQRLFATGLSVVVEVGPGGTVFTANQLTPEVDLSMRGNLADWGIQAYEP